MTNQPALSAFASAWAPRLLSVLRIMTALMFVTHGLVKVFGFPAGAMPEPVQIATLLGLAGVMELVGGVAILVGLFTRLIAFLLAGEMAFAYFIAHAPQNFFPVLNGGEMAITFCFTFLYLAAAEAGEWSVDAKRNSA